MHHLDVASCQCMSTTLTLSCLSSRECDMTLHALARYARPSVLAFCNGRRSSNRACLGAVCDWARSPADLVVCPWHSSRLFFCFAQSRNSDETSEGDWTNNERDREAGITEAKTLRRHANGPLCGVPEVLSVCGMRPDRERDHRIPRLH